MKTPAAPFGSEVPVWSPVKRPGRPVTLGVELFSSRADAEAQLHHWEGQGLRNLWLHQVQKVEIGDLPAAAQPVKGSVPAAASGPFYALVRVG